MDMHRFLILGSFLACLGACGERPGGGDSSTARDSRTASGGTPAGNGGPRIELLEPAAFTGMPQRAADHFTVRGCRVPQSPVGPRPSNLVVGRFAQRRQTDWAALCARGERMMVRIAWGGPSPCPDSIPDTEQKVADDRTLGVADSLFVAQREPRAEGRALSVEHDGIAVTRGTKLVIWYCGARGWVEVR